MSNAPRPSKNERRDAAREKARQERLRQQKREKRSRAVLQLSIGVVIVAIVAVVAVIIVNSVRPPGPGPANMANGGITLEGPQLTAVRTAAPAASATPTPERTAPDGKVLIQVWEDFGCPVCQVFEQTNGTQIRQLVTSGAAVVQYHPIAFLDRSFTDGSYSTRAANAAAAVANYSPDSYSAFHAELYKTGVQPQERGPGLSDDRLIAIAKQSGASDMPAITTAIRDQQFKSWVGNRTDEFLEDRGALKGIDFSKRLDQNGAQAGPGTPTVIVNGQYYDGGPNDASAFGSFVTSVGGATSGSSAPSSSPSASD